MMWAALTWAGRAWTPAAAGLFAGIVAVLAWSYARGGAGRIRAACFALKALGAGALALCLLEPLWSGQRASPGANLFAVLADNSQSLQVKDRDSARSRGEELRDRLDPGPGGWPAALAAQFEVRRYLFDSRLQGVRDFGELTLEGRSSALGAALRSLAERHRGRPLAGVLLFTDGNATDLPDGVPTDLAGLPPVYPVVIGGGPSPRDLSIQQAQAGQSEFEDAPVTVQAVVAAAGLRGRRVATRLLDESGKVVARQVQTARGDGEGLTFRFQFKPDKPGLAFYEVRTELDDAKPDAPSEEATLANNRRVVVVDRGEGPHRILYVSGRPNWEFKFLNRAVQEDPQLELTALIRVARREPKFDFRGRAGETSNPLYRGTAAQAPEEVERYDQPVVVRLNTRDEFELRNGFPRAPEDLYAFRGVIVADVEAEFFAPDQAALLERFVSERGGGVLMLGGMESFREGKYQRTPVGEMLPVYLDAAEDAAAGGPMRLKLTREGMLQAWARLRDNEADERSRLQAMPPFLVMNRVREIKPGASVLATAVDEAGKEHPALVAQRFGKGRTAAFTIGDFWRWGLHDAASHADLDKAWRQMLRWLVADVPDRVQLAAELQPEDPNGAVRLETRVRDAKFQPVDNATVVIEVQPVLVAAQPGASTNLVRLQAEPSLREPGLYEATYVPHLTGGFRALACATNSAGAEVGRARAGWSSDLAAEEFRSLTANTTLLETLARRTGGEVVKPAGLEAFVKALPARKAPVMESWSRPLWHTPATFGFALACLVAEWGLRRWKGMP